MAETPGPSRREEWLEIVIATVLSISGLATSWAGYQAALYDGEQAAHFSRHDALRVAASGAQLEAQGRRSVQINLFMAWLEARARGEERLAALFQTRFPPELNSAFQAWVALDPLKNPAAPSSPFDMPNYRPRGEEQAKRLEAHADALFEEGRRDRLTSDHYTQAAVFMSIALFFGGIGQVFKVRPVRLALLAVAIIALLLGVARILSLPAMRPL